MNEELIINETLSNNQATGEPTGSSSFTSEIKAEVPPKETMLTSVFSILSNDNEFRSLGYDKGQFVSKMNSDDRMVEYAYTKIRKAYPEYEKGLVEFRKELRASTAESLGEYSSELKSADKGIDIPAGIFDDKPEYQKDFVMNLLKNTETFRDRVDNADSRLTEGLAKAEEEFLANIMNSDDIKGLESRAKVDLENFNKRDFEAVQKQFQEGKISQELAQYKLDQLNQERDSLANYYQREMDLNVDKLYDSRKEEYNKIVNNYIQDYALTVSRERFEARFGKDPETEGLATWSTDPFETGSKALGRGVMSLAPDLMNFWGATQEWMNINVYGIDADVARYIPTNFSAGTLTAPIQHFNAADSAKKWINETMKVDEETANTLAFKSLEVIGNLGSQIALAAATGGTSGYASLSGLSGKALYSAVAKNSLKYVAQPSTQIMAMSMGGSGYSEAYNALEGLPEEERINKAFKNMLANYAIGFTEGVPMTAQLSRLNKVTKGELAKQVFKNSKANNIYQIGSGAVKAGGEEVIQETFSNFLMNVAEKNIYNETKNILEGITDGSSSIFTGTTVLNALLLSLGKKKGSIDRDRAMALVDDKIFQMAQAERQMAEALAEKARINVEANEVIEEATADTDVDSDTALNLDELVADIKLTIAPPVMEVADTEIDIDGIVEDLAEAETRALAAESEAEFKEGKEPKEKKSAWAEKKKKINSPEAQNKKGQRITHKGELRQALRSLNTVMTDEQIGYVVEVFDKVAETWASKNKATKTDWYTSRLAAIRKDSFKNFVSQNNTLFQAVMHGSTGSVQGPDMRFSAGILHTTQREDVANEFATLESNGLVNHFEVDDDANYLETEDTESTYHAYADVKGSKRGILPALIANPNVSEDIKEKARKLEEDSIENEDNEDIAKKATELLLEAGFDGIKYTNKVEGVGEISYGLANPKKVRKISETAPKLFQRDVEAKAAVQFDQEGRAIITAFESADVSSFVHELAHIFERDLSDSDRKALLNFYGIDGDWNVEASELFARGFERYLAEGIAPSKRLTELFEKFKKFLIDIYGSIKDSSIDVKISDDVRSLYSVILGGKPFTKATEKLAKSQEELDQIKAEKEAKEAADKAEREAARAEDRRIKEENKKAAEKKRESERTQSKTGTRKIGEKKNLTENYGAKEEDVNSLKEAIEELKSFVSENGGYSKPILEKVKAALKTLLDNSEATTTEKIALKNRYEDTISKLEKKGDVQDKAAELKLKAAKEYKVLQDIRTKLKSGQLSPAEFQDLNEKYADVMKAFGGIMDSMNKLRVAAGLNVINESGLNEKEKLTYAKFSQIRDTKLKDIQNFFKKIIVSKTADPDKFRKGQNQLSQMIQDLNDFRKEQGKESLSENEVLNLLEFGNIAGKNVIVEDAVNAIPKLKDDTLFQLSEKKDSIKERDTKISNFLKDKGLQNKGELAAVIKNIAEKTGQKISKASEARIWNEIKPLDPLEAKKKKLIAKVKSSNFAKRNAKGSVEGRVVDADTISKVKEISSRLGIDGKPLPKDKAMSDVNNELNRADQANEDPDSEVLEISQFFNMDEMTEKELDDAAKAIDDIIKEGRTKRRKILDENKQKRQTLKKNAIETLLGKILPENWDKKKEYVKGDTFYYNGRIYTVKESGKVKAIPKDGVNPQYKSVSVHEGLEKVEVGAIAGFFRLHDSMDEIFDLLASNTASQQYEGYFHKEFVRRISEATISDWKLTEVDTIEINKKIIEIFAPEALEKYNKSKKTKKDLRALVDESNRIIREMSTVEDFTYTDSEGEQKTIEMSQGIAYKKWMELQDPELAPTFEKHGFGEKFVEAIEAYLSPESKAFAEWQLNEFYPKIYQRINPVYRKVYGVDLPNNIFYSSIEREGEINDEENLGINNPKNPVGSIHNSHLISRRKNTNKLKFVDGNSVLTRYVYKMNHFATHAELVKDLSGVFYGSDVKQVIEAKFGKDINNVIEQYIQSMITKGVYKGAFDKVFSKIVQNISVAALAYNLSLIPKQMASMTNFMAAVPTGEWFKGVKYALTNPNEVFTILNGLDYTQDRYGGKGFSREMVDAIDADRRRNNSRMSKFVETGMLPIKWGDQGALFIGGWAVYKHHYDKTLKETGSEAKAKKEAEYQFGRAASRFGQSGWALDRSIIDSGNSFVKLFMMFKSAPRRYFAITNRIIFNHNKGRITTKQALKQLFILNILTPTIYTMTSLGGSLFDDEDEMPLGLRKEFAQQILSAPTSGLFGAGVTVDLMIDAIIGKLSGEPVNITSRNVELSPIERPLALGAQVFNGLLKMTDDDISTEDIVETLGLLGRGASDFGGIPTKPVRDVVSFLEMEDKDLRVLMGYTPKAINVDEKKTSSSNNRYRGMRPQIRMQRPNNIRPQR
jgi:hypothetical protein